MCCHVNHVRYSQTNVHKMSKV